MEKRKKVKKLQMIMAAAAAFFLVFLVRGNVSAAQVQPIVPAVGGAGSASTYQYEVPVNEKGGTISIPVQVSRAGEVKLDVSAYTESDTVSVLLSPTSDFSQAVATEDILDLAFKLKNEDGSGRMANLHAYAPGACTWYLHVLITEQKALTLSVAAYQDTVERVTNGQLKDKTWTESYADFNQDAYLQVKAGSSGCFKVELVPEGGDEDQSMSVILLDSKKREVSPDGDSYNKITYYAVKKGTYYLKVSTWGNFRIRSTFESIKEKNNTKKEKAVVLKKGKTEKGLFQLGGKKYERYYKVTVPKNQTVKFNIQTKGNYESQFSYALYRLNGKKLSEAGDGSLKLGKNSTKIKLKKGTYYFVVESYVDTGSFSIQWK